MINLPCLLCGKPEGLRLVDRGQHTALFACSCGNSSVVDRLCHNTCGCINQTKGTVNA